MFIYGTYVLEGEADAKFSLGDIWNLLQAGLLPNNANSFCRQMTNCKREWNYIQKTSGSPLSIETTKQTHKIMMDKEKHRDRKDVLVRKYRKSPAFAGYHIFATASFIKRYKEAVIFRFHETKTDDQIMNYDHYKFVWKHYQYTSI